MGRLASIPLTHGLFGFGYVVTATFIVAAIASTFGWGWVEGQVLP